MPSTFLYLMALVLWVTLAVAVWLVSGVLLLLPRKRNSGLRLASAMAGTFPAVIAYQIIAAPIILTLLLTSNFVCKIIEPRTESTTENPAVIFISIVALLLSFAIAAGMSLTGFCEGWRTGWLMASGEGLISALKYGPTARVVCLLIRRSKSA
jgi:hypothetical protein